MTSALYVEGDSDIALRITVYQEHAMPGQRQTMRKIDRGCGLTGATL
jgi:hypothetical protein